MSGAVELLTSGSWSHWHWAVPAVGVLVYVIRLINGQTKNLGGFPIAIALALGLTLGGCAHVPTPAPDCKTAALALLGELASALVQENWSNAVDALVTDPHGGLCAVEEGLQIIASQSAANAGTGDTLEATKAQRAKSWLLAHGVTS